MEVGLDGCGGDFEDWAEEGGIRGEDGEGFGCRNGAAVGVVMEEGAGFVDEGGEGAGGDVGREDGVGAEEEERDQVPFVRFGGAVGGDAWGVWVRVGPGD